MTAQVRAIEIAETIYNCFGSADLFGVMACLDDNIQWRVVGPTTVPYAGTFSGHIGVQQFFGRLLESVRIEQFEPIRFVDGGQVAVVFGREQATVIATGKTFETEWSQVFEVTDGKVVRWTEYLDTAPLVTAFSS